MLVVSPTFRGNSRSQSNSLIVVGCAQTWHGDNTLSPCLISALMQNPSVERQAWSFVQGHWASIDKLGGAFAGAAIVQATGSFCDAGMREQVKTFFTTHPAPAAERSFKQSLERINNCIDLRTQQQEQLASWLKQKQGSEVTAAGEPAAPH